MKIPKDEISYIEYLCRMLPIILKDFNKECEENNGHYIFQSPNRARFDRLRIEMNKTLLKIKKEIYNEK